MTLIPNEGVVSLSFSLRNGSVRDQDNVETRMAFAFCVATGEAETGVRFRI